MTDQALHELDAAGASSTVASIANVVTIADADEWPPPFIGTFQVRDDESEYNIGDYYATEMSEALRRARRHDTTGKEVVD